MYQKAVLKTATGEPVITVTILRFAAAPDVLMWGERAFKYEAHQGDTPHYKECFAHAVTPIPGVDDNGFTVRQRAEIEAPQKISEYGEHTCPRTIKAETLDGLKAAFTCPNIRNGSPIPAYILVDLGAAGIPGVRCYQLCTHTNVRAVYHEVHPENEVQYSECTIIAWTDECQVIAHAAGSVSGNES